MIDGQEKKMLEFAESLNIVVFKNESMAKHTTFKIGGFADFFITVDTEEKLAELIKFLYKNAIDYCIIGNGSNLLVTDENIHKVVIQTTANKDKIQLIDDTNIYAFAGVFLPQLCDFALENALTGLEFACGIPAKLGGAIYMNAAAYGSDMAMVLKEIYYIDETGNKQKISANDAQFGYKNSIFMHKKYTIAGALLELQNGRKEQIANKMQELLVKRRNSQPLELPNAGSIFRRPQGHFAGRLVEECGLKGRRVGQAMVSEKHAGFIVNLGEAKCSEVLELIKIIQNEVWRQKGLKLETEVEYLC
ncbi:MAG: UDP-N-acetylmuramate dehydrogenase [Oscillospiraceae bacterium]